MPLTQLSRHQNTGFTLIEVLVAALILAIGILGIATTLMVGLKSDRSAYYRSQASAIAADMADRLRINREKAVDYSGIDTNNDPPANPACITTDAGCDGDEQVAQDTWEWFGHFSNVSNLAAYSPKLPGGRGQVTQDGAGRFVITISWSEDDWDPADLDERTLDITQSVSVTLAL